LGVAGGQFAGRLESFGTRCCPQDTVVGPIVLAQVAFDGAEDDRIVVNGQNDGFRRGPPLD
ncbi:MAG TPA: hypothetical protein VLL51_05265, partial [Gemmatimonadales bacterium]|nr:hypothetical protein [Gemmatimonadales bacterium]